MKKLMKTMKFAPNLDKKVDMEKVNLDTVKPWVTQRVTDMLGFEDDVLIEFVFNLLENEKQPDPKMMQINLTGFLNGRNARVFMQELWDLLLSAQDSTDQLVKASDDNSCENQPEYDTVSIKLDHNLDIPMSSNPAYA
jgi:serine/arginine repetitive matrix protein 1